MTTLGAHFKKNPCFGCEKRVLACHTRCAEYIRWKKELLAIRKTERKQKETEERCWLERHDRT